MDPDDPARAASPAIRVASVPHRDPYVDAVLPAGVVRVGREQGPSPWLDPAYLTAHADEVDVVHVHRGYGHLPEDEIVCFTEAIRRTGVPLVTTVHQLRDPAQLVQSRHEAHLRALLATAEVVFTLTPGAADEIADRFGRTPIVVAHPSVAAPDPEIGGERGLVGLALRESPCVPDPAVVVRAALHGALNGGGRLRVFVEPGYRLPHLGDLAESEALELDVLDEARWPAQLQELHAAVLPESCGTHSTELEICRDVGTRVIAPSCGWFADQWSDVVTYGNDEVHGFDPVSLNGAVAAALTRPAPRPADRVWREQQRTAVQDVHAQVYAQLAGDRVAP
ncbi:glycosyltransferase [Blastococcus sp. URHD0036]|uniref:glycosyltransferase n=1 Tax=Blastococcus sp. URHD0036 TaxID=1380356 RepID=UPI000495C9D4|nr:glycosyltransferase [Blastococcus sp. URHD0036]